MTNDASEFAVPTGSAFAVVGTSEEPNADTISLMPAAAYWDLIVARSESLSVVHSYALSQAPAVSQNEARLYVQDVSC